MHFKQETQKKQTNKQTNKNKKQKQKQKQKQTRILGPNGPPYVQVLMCC